MSAAASTAVDTAKAYYNSEDADNFYFTIWGGEDIHVGLYRSPDEPISTASRRTVEQMAARLQPLDETTRVLDLGSGYGGAARYLAGRYGCHVTALNLSEVENERNRSLNNQQKLSGRIEVIDGNFEDLPFADGSFDVVWSQDAILHSGNRGQVVREAARVLKRGGQLIFTDPMQADDCPANVLQPILDRIHLETLGSPAFYRAAAAESGLQEADFDAQTEHLSTHYARVLEETQRRYTELVQVVSPEYIERMQNGLRHWVDGGKQGYLAWGIFHFRKP